MKPLYDPTTEHETLTERGLFDPRNYVAAPLLIPLIFALDAVIGYGVWVNIAWTFTLIPTSLETIQMWKMVAYGAVVFLWFCAFCFLGEEWLPVNLFASAASWLVLVFVL